MASMLIDSHMFTVLVDRQARRYTPLFKKYPGHWALRRDMVWVPEKAEYVKGADEQPFILDVNFSKHHDYRGSIRLGLECLQEELGTTAFAIKANQWLKENP